MINSKRVDRDLVPVGIKPASLSLFLSNNDDYDADYNIIQTISINSKRAERDSVPVGIKPASLSCSQTRWCQTI